jgi:hypothetical protein
MHYSADSGSLLSLGSTRLAEPSASLASHFAACRRCGQQGSSRRGHARHAARRLSADRSIEPRMVPLRYRESRRSPQTPQSARLRLPADGARESSPTDPESVLAERMTSSPRYEDGKPRRTSASTPDRSGGNALYASIAKVLQQSVLFASAAAVPGSAARLPDPRFNGVWQPRGVPSSQLPAPAILTGDPTPRSAAGQAKGSSEGAIAPWTLAKSHESATEGTLHGAQRSVQLLAHFAERKALQIRPFNHTSLEFRKLAQLILEPLTLLLGNSMSDPRVAGPAASRIRVRNGRLSLERSSINPNTAAAKLVDQVPTGDQHDPGHQFGPSRIEPISGTPEPDEDLLNSVFGLNPGGEGLTRRLVDQRTETIVQLGHGGLIARRHPLHEVPVLVDHVAHLKSGLQVDQTLEDPYERECRRRLIDPPNLRESPKFPVYSRSRTGSLVHETFACCDAVGLLPKKQPFGRRTHRRRSTDRPTRRGPMGPNGDKTDAAPLPESGEPRL